MDDMQGFMYVQNSMIYALYSLRTCSRVEQREVNPVSTMPESTTQQSLTHSVPSMVLLSKKSKYSSSIGFLVGMASVVLAMRLSSSSSKTWGKKSFWKSAVRRGSCEGVTGVGSGAGYHGESAVSLEVTGSPIGWTVGATHTQKKEEGERRNKQSENR